MHVYWDIWFVFMIKISSEIITLWSGRTIETGFNIQYFEIGLTWKIRYNDLSVNCCVGFNLTSPNKQANKQTSKMSADLPNHIFSSVLHFILPVKNIGKFGAPLHRSFLDKFYLLVCMYSKNMIIFPCQAQRDWSLVKL